MLFGKESPRLLIPRRASVFGALFAFAGTCASAQSTAGPETSRARIRIGPVIVVPTLALTNAGVDSNVFNEPDQASPKSDFTVTVTPAADLWLKTGRTWLTGNVKEDLVYYNTYASERSVNSRYKAAWLVPLNRIKMNVGADYLSARERPGFEIAARWSAPRWVSTARPRFARRPRRPSAPAPRSGASGSTALRASTAPAFARRSTAP